MTGPVATTGRRLLSRGPPHRGRPTARIGTYGPSEVAYRGSRGSRYLWHRHRAGARVPAASNFTTLAGVSDRRWLPTIAAAGSVDSRTSSCGSNTTDSTCSLRSDRISRVADARPISAMGDLTLVSGSGSRAARGVSLYPATATSRPAEVFEEQLRSLLQPGVAWTS